MSRISAFVLPLFLIACGQAPQTDQELAHELVSQSLQIVQWPGSGPFSNNDRYVSISVADTRADVNYEVVDAKEGGRSDGVLAPYSRTSKTWINPGLEGSNGGFVNIEAHSEPWPLFFGVRVTLSYTDPETDETIIGLPIETGPYCVAD